MITVTDLKSAYGDATALHGICASFPRGQLTSMIGPNGAGKTTLLMLMAKLLTPTRGHIQLDGTPVRDLAPRDYARRVATLRQAPGFDLRLTVEELVGFGRFPHSGDRLTGADHVAVAEAISFLSLDDLRKRHIDELSGGQRQVAFLAMTIAQETDCLLLDEPLNNLDMHHAVQIMRSLRSLCDDRGRTVILVIHDINFAANYSDCILALKDGRLVASGPVESVVTEDLLAELFNLKIEIQRRNGAWLCNYFTPDERT